METLRLLAAFSNGRPSRKIRKWAAICGAAGSRLTRYGWILAGRVSARDWRLPLEIPDGKAVPQPLPEKIPEIFRANKHVEKLA